MPSSDWWVYMLLCENNTYYTGYTNNLTKRYQAHLAGKGSKYTRSFKPISIAKSWKIPGGKCDAMKAERSIKKLTRQEKEKIVHADHDQWLLHFTSENLP